MIKNKKLEIWSTWWLILKSNQTDLWVPIYGIDLDIFIGQVADGQQDSARSGCGGSGISVGISVFYLLLYPWCLLVHCELLYSKTGNKLLSYRGRWNKVWHIHLKWMHKWRSFTCSLYSLVCTYSSQAFALDRKRHFPCKWTAQPGLPQSPQVSRSPGPQGEQRL